MIPRPSEFGSSLDRVGNATNRPSLLQALMAALGSERVSLKGDAEEGHVELAIGDGTYTRTLTRTARSDSTGPASISTGQYRHSRVRTFGV